jgi:hypothetical protein
MEWMEMSLAARRLGLAIAVASALVLSMGSPAAADAQPDGDVAAAVNMSVYGTVCWVANYCNGGAPGSATALAGSGGDCTAVGAAGTVIRAAVACSPFFGGSFTNISCGTGVFRGGAGLSDGSDTYSYGTTAGVFVGGIGVLAGEGTGDGDDTAAAFSGVVVMVPTSFNAAPDLGAVCSTSFLAEMAIVTNA